MKYRKRFGLLISTIILSTGFMVLTASAQTRTVRRVYYRPYVVRHFWGYDPFWHDPYLYDPYLRAQRDKYYKEKAVRDASRKLAKDRAKYQADGVLTAKEQEKLIKRRQDYEKAVAKREKFYRESY